MCVCMPTKDCRIKCRKLCQINVQARLLWAQHLAVSISVEGGGGGGCYFPFQYDNKYIVIEESGGGGWGGVGIIIIFNFKHEGQVMRVYRGAASRCQPLHTISNFIYLNATVM